jgi:ABC-type Zn uptake system ZnuABC Zn-binding protein ZnuA
VIFRPKYQNTADDIIVMAKSPVIVWNAATMRPMTTQLARTMNIRAT